LEFTQETFCSKLGNRHRTTYAVIFLINLSQSSLDVFKKVLYTYHGVQEKLQDKFRDLIEVV